MSIFAALLFIGFLGWLLYRTHEQRRRRQRGRIVGRPYYDRYRDRNRH